MSRGEREDHVGCVACVDRCQMAASRRREVLLVRRRRERPRLSVLLCERIINRINSLVKGGQVALREKGEFSTSLCCCARGRMVDGGLKAF